mmetsp:Transcript_4313/g.13609  ORF Transcript_4313/g.13609 Transcript_4313/m.13609 type:complete len:111 (-) Transcript_4313:1067-1399(-)
MKAPHLVDFGGVRNREPFDWIRPRMAGSGGDWRSACCERPSDASLDMLPDANGFADASRLCGGEKPLSDCAGDTVPPEGAETEDRAGMTLISLQGEQGPSTSPLYLVAAR